MHKGLTRRSFLSVLPPSLVLAVSDVRQKRMRSLPQVGEFVRFVDPLTENIVVRLTNPGWESVLPAPVHRFIAARERFLVFSSTRFGPLSPLETDLRTGRSRLLCESKDLAPRSLCLDARERALYLLDGKTVREITLSNLRTRTIAEGADAFALEGHSSQVLVLKGTQLIRVSGRKIIADGVNGPEISVRPSGEGCFFERAPSSGVREIWYVSFAGLGESKPKLLAKGNIWNPIWNPNGQSLLFLREIEINGVPVPEIHEVLPDTGMERPVERTSQFAAFAPNGNGSVFVGASRSKAQPTVDLLLRSPQRELTLCEHRSTKPASVSPVFSPDSRRVYFQSDHEGKSALYAVNVERLVEPTL